MATAHALCENNIRVIYSKAQTFTDHVVSAIRAGEMSVFRQAYRNADVLLLDDVHVFSKKGATQEEFFHTFNTLHTAGKQIVFSANCAPNELQLIEPRLVSRFEWGIVLSLELPKRQELSQILQSKAGAMNYLLQPKLAEFFLNTFNNSKTLCRALEALILRSHLNQKADSSPTIAYAREILSNLIIEEEKTALTPLRIIQKVAGFFGIRPEDILGKAQTRDCVLPRQIAMYLCRNQLKIPYTKIGELFKKDHSTVISSVKLIQKGIDINDPEIASAHSTIFKRLQ
jgi:chromosomal replication initiator protein